MPFCLSACRLLLPLCRFFFYTVQDMCKLRPLEETASLHPGVQRLEAWLTQHKEQLAPLFV
jgi:hypothetical protein